MPELPDIPVVLIAAIVTVLALAAFAASRYKVAKPNEALIIAGSKRSAGGIRVVVGGGAIVYPLINKAERISLEVRSLPVELHGAVTNQGVPIAVQGIVNVKVADDENSIRQAAQRFLDSQQKIAEVVSNVMEGSLRTIIGTMSVENLISDRETFATNVQKVANEDLQGTGLAIDVFTIQSIQDSAQYIENLGRRAASLIRRDAEIAEADAQRESREKQEAARQQILEAEKATSLKQQAINQEVAAATARADQAKPLADAEARKQVVEQETQVADLVAKRREKELNAEVRAVAEAKRYEAEQQAEAERYRATAEAEADAAAVKVRAEAEAFEETQLGTAKASAIQAVGEAEAAAMVKRAEAYKQYNEAAVLELLMERMPEIATAIASPLAAVDNLTIVDVDGASKLPQTVTKVFGELDAIVKGMTGTSLSEYVASRQGGVE